MQVIGYTFEGGYCLCDDCCPDDSESPGAIFPWDEGASRMTCDNCLSRLRGPLSVNEYDVAEILKEIGCRSSDPQQLEASFTVWLELQPEDLDASDVDWTEVAEELQRPTN